MRLCFLGIHTIIETKIIWIIASVERNELSAIKGFRDGFLGLCLMRCHGFVITEPIAAPQNSPVNKSYFEAT